ncbi:MAG: signal peptidase II [Actinomycetota bacterium]
MLPLLAVASLVLVADQVTKYAVRVSIDPNQSITLVKGFFYFTHVRNTGAAFGMFSQKQPVFVVATIIAIVLIIVYHLKTKEADLLFNLALGLELGGAAGNLVDRISLGWVTDFMHVPNFPVFNIADSAIVTGVALLILVMLRDIVRERREKEADVSDTV